MKISICIITYNRPKFLLKAVESCLKQSLLPDEILIGDDSQDDVSKIMVAEITKSTPVKIKYFQNRPSLKQAMNINSLFSKVKGEFTVLLHDDDLLLPDALENLYSCFVENSSIDVSFGKQYVMSEQGKIDKKDSEILNQSFFRTAAYEGMKLTSLESGFLQQFPNDCYMIRSALAKEVMYKNTAMDACDFDFGLRVGMSNAKLFFLNKYVAKYRISSEAVSKNASNNASLRSYEIVEGLDVPQHSVKYKSGWLLQKAPLALRQAIRLNQKQKARKIFFSKWYKRKIFTPAGVKNLFLLVFQ